MSRTAAPTGDRKKCLALLPRRRMGGEGVGGRGRGREGGERVRERVKEKDGS